MRSYLLDEISPSDLKKINSFLEENAVRSSLNQLFWIKMPEDILSEIQFQHRHCQPHVFAVELGREWIKLEFYVRSLTNMRCTCPGYGTRQQREFIINFAHTMIERLDIRT